MRGRMVPLLIALAVAGAPVAIEACHIACAALSTQSATHAAADHHAAHGASCHDAVESQAPVSIRAQPCDHGGDLPTTPGIGSVRHSKVTVSLAVAPTTGRLAVACAGALITIRSGSRERTGVHLAVPLRI